MVEACARINILFMKGIFFLTFIFIRFIAISQTPKNGTYIYKLCFAEWGKCMNTCKVRIKGDSIIVYALEDLSIPKNEIIDAGIILKHKSGKWIIGKSQKDKNAAEIGGCSEGPLIIDFKKKRVWTC
jgi:hypothetical protein